MQLKRASNQASIVLGKELGRGGEGAVYPVTGMPDLVAKIYLKPPAALKVEKLRSMARRASPALLRVAAWPIDLLTDATGAVRGFLMHKVSAREDVHELYSPKSRRRSFPSADFRFVVRAAANIARAFAQVHSVGNVIGDVNHGNALVGRDGTVVLIDCDSFQVRDGARVFTCDVGVPLFTAPELAGQSFRGLKRTADHDAFGLAVLVFHLLYIGRHPFAGKHAAGDMPIERAIAESLFAYGADSASRGVTAPPATLLLGVFGPAIAQLFERAFAGPGDLRRPSAADWVTALQTLESELAQCAVNERHQHPGALPCCWCELETRAGVPTFGGAAEVDKEDAGALATQLWKDIKKLPAPERVSFRPPVLQWHEELKDQRRKREKVRDTVLPWVIAIGWIAGAVTIPGFAIGSLVLFFLLMASGLLWLVWKIVAYFLKPKADRGVPVPRKPDRWEQALARWKACVDGSRYFEVRDELKETVAKLSDFSRFRSDWLAAVIAPHETGQLEKFLSGFPLRGEKFVDVTRADIEKLASEGIKHAGDVMRERGRLHHLLWLAAVRELLAWVDVCAVDFQFDSEAPQVRADLKAAENALEEDKAQGLRALREGPDQLRRIADGLANERHLAELDLVKAYQEMGGERPRHREQLEAE